MCSAPAIDWAARYQDLQDALSRLLVVSLGEGSGHVEPVVEEAAWEIIEPLSGRLWVETRDRLSRENLACLAIQTYCVALEAVMRLLDKLDGSGGSSPAGVCRSACRSIRGGTARRRSDTRGAGRP